MAPAKLFDLAGVDMDAIVYDLAAIEETNPHRGHMRMLDGVIHLNDAKTESVGFKDVRDDEFWVAGHIPGRPIFPGILQIELAAQLASLVFQKRTNDGRFMGFTGLDKVKFRGQVVPGDRLIMLIKEVQFRPRRFIIDARGYVEDVLVVQAQVTGMPI